MFYSANTMVRDVIQCNLMCTTVCLLTQYLPKRVGRQGNPAWEESGAVQDKLVHIQEKGRVEMMHQDSCARAHAVAVQFVSCNQVNRLHVPHCTFTR